MVRAQLVENSKHGPIPVMRPRLPSQSELAPYLRMIDENRVYTNFGPLHRQLEVRLAEYLGVSDEHVLLLANGTLALQGAVGTSGGNGSEWVMPSWTFVASAEAVSTAGAEICFADVDADTWALRAITEASSRPHMVVAPFGAPPHVAQWRHRVGSVPMIIDAASCFDACRGMSTDALSNSMVMISLHATKLVTTGEGGVLVGDPEWIRDVKRWSNFGFRGRRIADVRGTNAKLSEYGAAVGLASFDRWDKTREELVAKLTHYRRNLLALGIDIQPSAASGHVTSTVVARFNSPERRDQCRTTLDDHGIETRAWWSEGVHQMATFADCKRREPLLVTEQLAKTTLGLPFFIDMSISEIDWVTEIIGSVSA
jgi:dTDP-4-amino-4,6-dideoxygalactose transaminase